MCTPSGVTSRLSGYTYSEKPEIEFSGPSTDGVPLGFHDLNHENDDCFPGTLRAATIVPPIGGGDRVVLLGDALAVGHRRGDPDLLRAVERRDPDLAVVDVGDRARPGGRRRQGNAERQGEQDERGPHAWIELAPEHERNTPSPSLSPVPTYEQAARRVLQRADELAVFTDEPGRITRPLLTAGDGGRESARAVVDAGGGPRDARGRDRQPRRPPRRTGPRDRLASGLRRRRRPLRRHPRHPGRPRDRGGAAGHAAGGRGLRRRGRPALPEHLPRQPRVRRRAHAAGARPPRSARRLAARGDRRSTSVHRCTRRDTRAYLEVHIEQGPVLESEQLALGVVTGIAGQSRFNLAFHGHAGHAGTTPMALRRDAATAAAEFVLAAERIALRGAGARRDGRRAQRPPRRRQRDPGPRRRDARRPPPGRRASARPRWRACGPRRRRSPSAAASP